MAPEHDLVLTDAPDEADVRAVRDGLIAFNERFLGPADHRPLAAFARDAGGRVVGGLVGETARGCLRVDLLWVADGRRGRGLGSRLLAAAEAEALARGCRRALLDTADFQARPFYERHGYRLVGQLDILPNGHASFLLAKELGGPTPGRASP